MIKLKRINIESPFKNLNGLEINFENSNGVTVLIGNNGSGKSNILEAVSSIFAGLYDNDNFNPVFKYEISYYKDDALINIKYDPSKPRNKYEKIISDDDPLPTQIISIYSGEEQRMWNRYYFTFYENFNKDVISGKKKYNEKQRMEFLNKYHWNITLLTMLASYLDISDIIQSKKITEISFHFKNHNTQNIIDYDRKNSNEVIRFAKLIYESSHLVKTVKDTEIRTLTFDEFIDLVSDTNIELFRKLAVSLLPKEDSWKLIDKMELFFAGDEDEDSFSTEELSEGQKKQLLIKFATKILADENSILLLDEPDSHIHISHKEKIKELLYEENDKPFVQTIITTHSPTLTSTFRNENVFMLKKEDSKVKIIDKEQQEIIKDLFGEKFSPQVQNMFLASNKPIILLVEGKHDKIHITNAFNHLKDDYPSIDFDVFSMGGEGKIHPFMNGLYEANIENNVIYIGIYDNDNAGITTLNKAGFEPELNNCGYRKLKKDKIEHKNFFAFPLLKPDGFTKDCTIENMFVSEKYEEAFRESLNRSIGHFTNKSIEDINKDIKNDSKNILAESSKDFVKEDFIHFRKLFEMIIKIEESTKSFTSKAVESILKSTVVSEIEQTIIVPTQINDVIDEKIKTFVPLIRKKSRRTVTENQHLKGKEIYIKNIYKLLKAEILRINSKIEIDSKVEYIAFKLNDKNVFDIKILKSKVILWVNKKKGTLSTNLEDLFTDCSNKGHNGNGDYELYFISLAEVEQFINDKVIEEILNINYEIFSKDSKSVPSPSFKIT